MKAVIYSINENSNIIDLCNNLDSFDLYSANYLLMSSISYFPKKSIFLCIVDPGVGTEREILLIRTSDFTILAPNNGIISFLEEKDIKELYKVNLNHELFLNKSNTFHGRDIFAVLAAKISKNEKFANMLFEYEKEKILKIDLKIINEINENSTGKILHIDKFGNIITSLRSDCFNKLKDFKIVIGESEIFNFSNNYDEMKDCIPTFYKGSSGFIEIAVKCQKCSDIVHARTGDEFIVKKKSEKLLYSLFLK